MIDEDGVDWTWCPQCFYCAPTRVFDEYTESERFDFDCVTVGDDPDSFTPAERDEVADLRASGVPGVVRYWPEARLTAWMELLTEELAFRRLTEGTT